MFSETSQLKAMWSSILPCIFFTVYFSNSLHVIGATSEASCHVSNNASRQIGVLESHVELLEQTIKSLRIKVNKLSDLSQTCGEGLSCPESRNITCPVCPQTTSSPECPVVTCPTAAPPSTPASTLPTDCAVYLERGHMTSGIYKIQPSHSRIDDPFDVYCDMETDGGGWTVFQRRDDYGDPRQNFFQDWDNYKRGFGNLSMEFWLGNDKLYALTNQEKMSLRIDVEDFEAQRRYATFEEFFVDSERALYTATFWDYEGNAGDALTGFANNSAFSTKDRDNDAYKDGSCSNSYKGGWWYGSCHGVNLNGLYLKGEHKSYADGVNWASFRGAHYSLKFSEMKIRPKRKPLPS